MRTVEWSPWDFSSRFEYVLLFCLYEDFSRAYYTIVMGQTGFLVSGLCVSQVWTAASNDAQYI